MTGWHTRCDSLSPLGERAGVRGFQTLKRILYLQAPLTLTIMAAVATPPDESAILLLGDGEQRSRKCLVATTAHSNVIRFGRPVPRNASHPFEVEGEC